MSPINSNAFPLYGLTVHHHTSRLTFKEENAHDLLLQIKKLCHGPAEDSAPVQSRHEETAHEPATKSTHEHPDGYSDSTPVTPIDDATDTIPLQTSENNAQEKQLPPVADNVNDPQDIHVTISSKASKKGKTLKARPYFINDSVRRQLLDFLKVYEFEFLPALAELWPDAPESLENGYSPCIIPSILEYRSIFTWLCHKIRQMSTLTSRKTRMRMEEVIGMLVEYLHKMVVDRLEQRKKYNGNLGMNLFCESIDFDSDPRVEKLHLNDFLENINLEYRYNFSWFYYLMVATTASFSKCNANIRSLSAKAKFGFYEGLYVLNTKGATEEMSRFFKTVTIDSGRALWNLQDDSFFRPFLFMNFPYVDCSTIFSIPSFTYEELTKDQIDTHYLTDQEKVEVKMEENERKKHNNDEGKEQEKSEEEKDSEKPVEHKNGVLVTEPNMEPVEVISVDENGEVDEAQIPASKEEDLSSLTQMGGITEKQFYHYRRILHEPLQDFDRKKIEIRMVYHGENRHLKSFNFNESRVDYPFLSRVSAPLRYIFRKAEKHPCDGSIIVMFHGGGMTAMSTFCHENYIRELTRETNLPIFMVEYITAPDERYPAQIEQCLSGYRWVLENAGKFLGMPLKKVFVTGDSAGGNFAAAVTARCIEAQYRIPDGCILSYPATNLASSPSPARVISLLDPLVNVNFIRLCAKYYPHEKANLLRDPFISPAFLPDKILEKFPPVMMSVGSLDPLYDDSIMFAERLTKLIGPKKVCLHVYDGLGHGYLNIFDMVHAAGHVLEDYARWIRGMIQRDD